MTEPYSKDATRAPPALTFLGASDVSDLEDALG
jgi:hypothetical protein